LNVDSYRFLPRSFRPLYEGRGAFPGEEGPVWAPFGKRLAEARVALLTSAGLFDRSRQEPFDLDGERADPLWGDPSWRAISAIAEPSDLGVSHLHINPDDLVADPEIAIPRRALEWLVADRVVGHAAPNHISVMGYQDRSLRGWRDETAPRIVEQLRRDQVDAVVLAPS